MRTATLYATGACNLRCKHCAVGLDQYKPRPELSTDQMKDVISALAKADTRSITILGGEPTIFRKDLKAILQHASAMRVGVSINTNLTDLAAVSPLLECPSLKSLVVSVDGATASTHDAVRGRGSFMQTTSNIRSVAQHARVRSRDLALEITFVLSHQNRSDASSMVPLAVELGTSRLNIKHVKLWGRAEQFAMLLSMSLRELLDAYCEVLTSWLLLGTVGLDMYLPPAAAEYMNRRFNLSLPVDDHPACGGINEFGYVDLMGNLLPCPAMSLEEDSLKGIDHQVSAVNLTQTSAQRALNAPLFQMFEENRRNGTSNTRMEPCNHCRFRTMCRPCTSDLVRGAETGSVDICAAVFRHGNEEVPTLLEFLSAEPAVERTS